MAAQGRCEHVVYRFERTVAKSGVSREKGSPWENGYNESFNGKLRDELLNGEIFYTLKEATVLIEQWRQHYNTIRPHSSLGYRAPAPESILPAVRSVKYLEHQPPQEAWQNRQILS